MRLLFVLSISICSLGSFGFIEDEWIVMKLSTRGEYGLRALVDLACHDQHGPIPCTDIAERQQIPQNYLNQLLIQLRLAGLIHSVRGTGGGHFLAKSPTAITVLEVITVLEGDTAPLDCLQDATGQTCQLAGQACVLRHLWLEVATATKQLLASKTLADLCHG
jgi:Rrf2 family protein